MESIQQPSILSRFFYYPITRILLGAIVCISSVLLIKEFITKPFFLSIAAEPVAALIVNVISTCLFVVAYYYVFRFYEKRPISELSTVVLGRELSFGLVFGFGVIALEFGVLYLSGNYEIFGIHSFDIFIKPFSFLLVMGLLEELFFRCILHRILEQWLGTVTALIISSVLFQLAHFGNDHEAFMSALLGFLFGLVMGIMYTYTQRLWLPFAFHFAWNFAQLVFGSTLSGTDDFGVMLDVRLEGPEWLIGSAFGIEDSVLTLIALTIIFVVYYIKAKRESKLVKAPWKR